MDIWEGDGIIHLWRVLFVFFWVLLIIYPPHTRIPGLGKQWQEDRDLKASLGYRRPYLNKREKSRKVAVSVTFMILPPELWQVHLYKMCQNGTWWCVSIGRVNHAQGPLLDLGDMVQKSQHSGRWKARTSEVQN